MRKTDKSAAAVWVAAPLCAMLAAGPVWADALGVPFDSQYEPFSYMDDGAPVGFDVDVAKAIGDELDVEITFNSSNFFQIQRGDWPEGNFFAVASMSKTPDREARFEFIGPYYYDTVVLVAADDGVEGFVPPAPEARIGVCRGCIYGRAIEGGGVKLSPDGDVPPASVTIREFGTDTDAIRHLMIAENGIDYAVTSAHVAERFVDAGFPVEISGYQLFVTPVWIVVPKGEDDMRMQVEDAFNALRDAGKIQPMWETHLQRDYINPINILGLGD